MQISRIKLKRLDYYLLFGTLAVVSLSLMLLFSVRSQGLGDVPYLFNRQLLYAVIGLFLMAGAALMSPRVHFGLAYVIYAICCAILLGVIGWGSLAKGAVRWIDVGLFTFQPSEPAKIGLILALARLLTDKKMDLNQPAHVLRAIILTGFPLMLVMAQPDLGTSIIFGSVFLFMIVAAGIPLGYLLILVSPLLAALTSFHALAFLLFMILMVWLAWRMKLYLGILIFLILGNLAISAATPYFWGHLKPYQQMRLVSFMNPEADPKGSGYQVIQSKVAVGSGGLIGKGLGQGSQTQLKFLPEQHTDFIFSMLGEELGLAGATAALLLYGLILVRGFRVAILAGGKYTALVCTGLCAMLLMHIFINIGMALGMMPVTGLPLPFLSYGGSFLWTSMIAVGIILGAHLRRGDYTP
ncbi:MAG: rod shape-determining protein RodA [Candidatus Zixiibacteriota bacterium]|nr:MAG: rod shape-determining protein RodA [candidate division Zixibacteria bacterium]